MMKLFRLLVMLTLAGSIAVACDCGGEKGECDCLSRVDITQPGSTVLTEFHDTNASEIGIQYPVAVQTICIPAGEELAFSNDLAPGESVKGIVELDDEAIQAGQVEFGGQTFEQGTNRICVRGEIWVNQMADGSRACSPFKRSVEDCVEVNVQLGIPACRFDDPADGALLRVTDDSSPSSSGFQHDVRVACKGVNDGEVVRLIVNGRAPLEGVLGNREVLWKDRDLAEGRNLLRVETTGMGGQPVASEIGVTVNTGGCMVRVLPKDGTVLRAGDDQNPGTDGLQATLTVETDAAGSFACANGSEVTLLVTGTEYRGTLSGASAAFQATLGDGINLAYATVKEPGPGGREGLSLTNRYFVCATPVEIGISSPRHGLTISDAVDRDPIAGGIQIEVTGTTSAVPAAENLRLLVDGAVVMSGAEPLQPATFFPGGAFNFQYASFLQSKAYNIQVAGYDACPKECGSDADCSTNEHCVDQLCMRGSSIHTIQVQTEQRTCLITDPQNAAVLLAANDKDRSESNDLQYDVHVVTNNVSDGEKFTLFISEQAPRSGLAVQNNLSINEATLADGEKTLQCVLDTGEASPAVVVTVDGHSPAVAIANPSDGSVFDQTDVTVELQTEGVEDGVLANLTVASEPDQASFTCTVTDNLATCPVVLFGQVGTLKTNTIAANVADRAGNPAVPYSISVAVLLSSDPPWLTFVDPDESSPQPISILEADRVKTVVVSVGNLISGSAVWLVVVDNGYQRTPLETKLSALGIATFSNLLLPRGSVELRASATNSVGTGSKSIELLVGTAGLPVVIITDPPDRTYLKQGTFNVTVDSNVPQDQVCFLCARTTPAVPSPPADCNSLDAIEQGVVDASGDATLSVSLSEGDYEIWGTCSDLSGNPGTSAPNRVVVDWTLPTVTFSQPTDGKVYNKASVDRSGQPGFQIEVELSADVEDGQGADLTVDGSPAAIIGNPPTFSGNLIAFGAVTVADQASHLLGARVCDKAGNCGSATPVSITVDRIAPMVTITSPLDQVKLGSSADKSAAAGFQTHVTCSFRDAKAGDTLGLERNIDGGGWELAAPSLVLTASQVTSGYTFNNVTIIPDDDPSQDPRSIQLRTTVSDAAANGGVDQVAIYVNRLAPEVIITRPSNNDNLNIFSDLGSAPGIQIQVNVETQHTELGDLLVLCASPGTGYPVGNCSGHGNEVWAGTVTGVVTYLSGVNLEQGDNTLVAFASNVPPEGTYSNPITVHVDSIPPEVENIVINTDFDGNGCLSSAELGGFQATVTVSDVGSGVEGRLLRLMENWPPGTQLASATISGGVAVLFVSLLDGDYHLTVTTNDGLGNPNIRESNPAIDDPQAQFQVSVDTVPPTIAIIRPSKTTLNLADDLNPATQNLDFDICVSTSAENGQQVAFKIEENPVGTATVSGGSACVRVSTGQGNFTLKASVSDFCGNAATTATLGVFVDTVKPNITCSQPLDSSLFSTQQVPFVCTTTGTDSTQKITVNSTIGGQRCTPGVHPSGTTSFTCTLLKGTQNLTVTVTDPVGNVSDPDIIGNITVNIVGCDIAFVGHSGIEVFNAGQDKDSNPGNGLQIDLTAHSNACASVNCSACRVTLRLDGVPFGSVQPLDAAGDVVFTDVGLDHLDSLVSLEVEIDDGQGNLASDSFTVELVDLYPPQLARSVPGGNNASCVAASGNPNVDGLVVLADKIAGVPCEMDFSFIVTDGGDLTYPGTLSIEQSGSPVAGPTSITTTPQTVNYINQPLAHNTTHGLDVVARDYVGNEVHIPMSVEVDVVAPGQISVGAAIVHTRHADVDLAWTAVGDDGVATGDATAYAIRWSRDAIPGETEWSAAIEIPNSINPGVPGSGEAFTAQWLPPLNTYHLVVRAVDEVGNHSPISTDLSLDNHWTRMSHTGPGGNFGYNLWNVGDVNHDNRDDLVVSAVTYNGNAGAVFAFYGEANLGNWSNAGTPQMLTRAVAGELLGWDVCGIGDLDGDLVADLVVSGYGFNTRRGRVAIYFGRSGARLPNNPDVEIRAVPATTTEFGRAAEILGDINQDGFADLFVGAPRADGNGRGYIFFGRTRTDWIAAATQIDPAPFNQNYISAVDADVNILGMNVDSWFGYRHGNTTLGDIDGDGADDFVLVASAINSVYAFDGSTIASITTRDVVPATDSVEVISYGAAYSDSNFMAGFGIRGVGGHDFTGDGLLDLIIGDAFHHQVYLFAGIDNTPNDPPVKIDPNFTKELNLLEGVRFGWDIDAKDINLDGRPDLIVGTNAATGNRAFIHLNTGSAPFFEDQASSTLSGGTAFGIGVALGDFNGDTLPDVAIGSLEGGTGILYVYY